MSRRQALLRGRSPLCAAVDEAMTMDEEPDSEPD